MKNTKTVVNCDKITSKNLTIQTRKGLKPNHKTKLGLHKHKENYSSASASSITTPGNVKSDSTSAATLVYPFSPHSKPQAFFTIKKSPYERHQHT
uniref:Putative ovule protein n=1 Tax=Solanum chacoense TaxID=4108 RepID=A0A0V0HTD6_SOLCH